MAADGSCCFFVKREKLTIDFFLEVSDFGEGEKKKSTINIHPLCFTFVSPFFACSRKYAEAAQYRDALRSNQQYTVFVALCFISRADSTSEVLLSRS